MTREGPRRAAAGRPRAGPPPERLRGRCAVDGSGGRAVVAGAPSPQRSTGGNAFVRIAGRERASL